MKVGRIITAATFLLIALAASVVAADNEVVRDVGGGPIKANTPYFASFVPKIMPGSDLNLKDGPGWLSRSVGLKCKPAVLISRSRRFAPQLKIIFVTSEDVVRVNTKLNIKFAKTGPCNNSGFWRAGPSLGSLVFINGSKSGDDSIFTVKKSNGDKYKLSFGPSVDPDDSSRDIFIRWIGNDELRFLQVASDKHAKRVLELKFISAGP